MDYNMTLKEASYGGKLFRPKPEVVLDQGLNLFCIATSWSTKQAAETFTDGIIKNYSLLSQDQEATSPFDFLSDLTIEQNNLRTAILLANDDLIKNNSKEYTQGIELFVGLKLRNEFLWAQIGNPSFFIKKDKDQLISLGSQKDLSFDFSSDQSLPPLPDELLGINKRPLIHVQSLKASNRDKFYFISHSQIGTAIQTGSIDSLDTLSKKLSDKMPLHPFWIGEINFSQ